MEAKLELRTLANSELRATETKSAGKVLSGYAASFGSVADIGGLFQERILPGAFSRTLTEGCDCRLLVNHQVDSLLARTRSRTLRLEQDKLGLRFVASIADTQAGRDAYALVQRGDMNACSFGFRVYPDGENWPSRKHRELLSVSLDGGDVSVVVYPAYETGTSVAARSQDRDNGIATRGVYHMSETDAVLDVVEDEIERLRLRLQLARAL